MTDRKKLEEIINSRINDGESPENIKDSLVASGEDMMSVGEILKDLGYSVSDNSDEEASEESDGGKSEDGSNGARVNENEAVSAKKEFKFISFFTEAFEFAWSKIPELFYIFSPLLITGIISEYFGVAHPGSFADAIFQILAMLAGIYSVALFYLSMVSGFNEKGGLPDFRSGLKFVIPLVIANIVSVAAFFGGTVLFLIPGIVLIPAISLIEIVVVKDDKRGIGALVGAWKVVSRGGWGYSFLVILATGVAMLVFGFILVILSAMASSVGFVGYVLGVIFISFFMIPVIGFGLHILFNLYLELEKRAKKNGAGCGEDSVFPKVMFWIGAILILLVLLSLVLSAGGGAPVTGGAGEFVFLN